MCGAEVDWRMSAFSLQKGNHDLLTLELCGLASGLSSFRSGACTL